MPDRETLVEMAGRLSGSQREEISQSDTCVVVVIQPALDPVPRMIRRRNIAVFCYINWSNFGVGLECLKGGIALQIGPLFMGIVQVDRFLGQALREHLRSKEIQGSADHA